MMRMKNWNWDKLVKNALAALPEIPYVNEKRSSGVLPFVLGGIGVALMGGIAAIMIFSPRTRYRALGVAKNAYGKVQDQIGNTAIGEKLGMNRGVSNGLSSDVSSTYTTGL